MFSSKVTFLLLVNLLFFQSLYTRGESYKDIIELENGDALTGNIKNISKDGIVSFQAKNLTGAAQLKTSFIHSINFKSEAELVYGQNLFLLNNGDKIPGKLKEITSDKIHISPVFHDEELVFPRNVLSKILFGIIPREPIYEGPNSSNEWSEFNRWRLHSKRMISNGKSIAARDVKLPKQFSIEFDYSWRGASRFKFFFADKTGDPKKKSDRYVLHISPPSNIKLYRQHEQKNQIDTPLKHSQFNLSNLNEQILRISIKGDLSTGYLKFSINDQEEAPISDLIDNIDAFGEGIMFQHYSGTDTQSTIRNIKINHWNPQSESHLADTFQSSKSESIVTVESDYFTGNIINFSTNDKEQATASIVTNLSETPLEIPEKQISVISFPSTKQQSETSSKKYKIEVIQDGAFFADQLAIDENTISCRHAILGNLKLDRNFVKSISVVHHEKTTNE